MKFWGAMLEHFGLHFGAQGGDTFFENGVKIRVLVPGGSKVVILDPQGDPKLSFWTILDLILEHFGPHFGQVSYQLKLQPQKSKMLMAGQGTVAGRPKASG